MIDFSAQRRATPMATRSAAATPDTRDLASDAATTEPASAADSIRLSLSEMTQKRLASMRRATAALRRQASVAQQARKDAARQRLADIKQRIALLKQLAAGLGSGSAKSTLRQIAELARELGQVAGVLKEPSAAPASAPTAVVTAAASVPEATGDATPVVEAVGPTDSGVDTSADSADQGTVGGDAPEADVADPAADDEQGDDIVWSAPSPGRKDEHARDDAEELKKVASQLKQLLAMVESQRAGTDDEESRRLVEGISAQVQACESAARELDGISLGALISVSV